MEKIEGNDPFSQDEPIFQSIEAVMAICHAK